MDQIPVALTIAGSDSGGGAGIQADLKTLHALGVFGTSALTAVTAQNTMGVTAVHLVPPEVIRLQIDAVAVDLGPRAVKSGMIATAAQMEVVADRVRAHRLTPYVLDPVMIASSGDRLIDRAAERALAGHLFPLATLVTPNLDEAGVLLGRPVTTEAEMRTAARALVDMGAGAALVKGGHLPGPDVVDLLWDGSRERAWRRPKLDTRNTHGTGCTLSAAVAAGLARGLGLEAAVDLAVEFVARAIDAAPSLGSGNGPLNHFVRIDLERSRRG
jgi:hydroxymethylpyrimidine/phosphomethylpyrimidine kinase